MVINNGNFFVLMDPTLSISWAWHEGLLAEKKEESALWFSLLITSPREDREWWQKGSLWQASDCYWSFVTGSVVTVLLF